MSKSDAKWTGRDFGEKGRNKQKAQQTGYKDQIFESNEREKLKTIWQEGGDNIIYCWKSKLLIKYAI